MVGNDDKLTLEVLIHFVDKDGRRIKPNSNRTRIPLQVSDITKAESVIIPMRFMDSIVGCIRDAPILHRLARDSNRGTKSKGYGK